MADDTVSWTWSAHSNPRGARIGSQPEGQRGQTITHEGAAPVTAERTASLDGVAGTGRPQQVDQHVGCRRGGEQHPLPARGHVDPSLLGRQSAAHLGRCASEVHLREVASGPARPRRPTAGSGLPAQLEACRRLVMPQPQATGRPEVGAGQAVLGVSEVVDVRRGKDVAEQRADRRELLGGGQRGRKVPGGSRGASGYLRGDVLRRPCSPGLGSGLRDEVLEIVARADHRTGRPRTDPARHVGVRHDVDRLPRGHPVGGQGRVRPPQIRRRGALDDHGPAVGPEQLEGAFHQLLGPHACASRWVLSTLIPSNTATGHPWLTGATWPGWALPQLSAPPSR